jgi:hypothetical protein
VSRSHQVPLPNWQAVMDTAMAAAYLSLSVPAFKRWALRSELKPTDLGNNRVLWRRSDIDAALAQAPLSGVDAANDEELAAHQKAGLAKVLATAARRRG